MFDLIPFHRRNELFFNNMVKSFNDLFDSFGATEFGTKSFRTDVRETDNAYYIDAELPGFEKDDIRVELKDRDLTFPPNETTCSKRKTWIKKWSAANAITANLSAGSTWTALTKTVLQPNWKTACSKSKFRKNRRMTMAPSVFALNEVRMFIDKRQDKA